VTSQHIPPRPAGVTGYQAWVGVLLALVLSLRPVAAADKKDKPEEKKPEPPRALFVLPLATRTGETNHIKIRGQFLTNVTALRLTQEMAGARLTLVSTSKVEVAKELEVKKVGDTQIEADFVAPAGFEPLTNYVVVTTPDGQSEAIPVVALPATQLVEETEPNGGFRKPQSGVTGKTMLGTIKESGDVDVFRFEGRRGQVLVARVAAARLGAPTDALLTLYDEAGRVIGSFDDVADSTDPEVRMKLSRDGPFFIAVTEAHDRGGVMFAYLLLVSLGE
jgi:hypothetical protein